MKSEEKIKNRLRLIQMEDNIHALHDFKRHYHFSKELSYQREKNQFKELSDWTNSRKQENALEEKEMLASDKDEADLINEMAHTTQRYINPFINRARPFDSTRYHSSLLNYSSAEKKKLKQKISISPIVIRFNARLLGENLQKSKENFIRKLKEEPLEQYKSLSQLYELRNKKIIPKKYELELQLPEVVGTHQGGIDVFRVTNRNSNAIQQMKKREPVRMRKRRNMNPEDLYAFKIY